MIIFDFVNKVSKLCPKNKKIVSFDVQNLFGNIPTIRTIDIIINKAFPEKKRKFNGLTKRELKELLIACTTQAHFVFNEKYYDQIDGVPMGSPLGPLLATAFMVDFEERHHNELKKLGVETWMRYVDDVFAELIDDTNEEEILNFLNNKHKNIKFTIEKSKNNTLPFLDTCVIASEFNYNIQLYHKPTFTGVYLNWTSLT